MTISEYLSGPLGMEKPRKTRSGQRPARPKTSASVTDLRACLGWGRATRTSQFRFNIERDPDRTINTDWFRREIIHGAITLEAWNGMSERLREGLNCAILRLNPDDDAHEGRLRAGLMGWAGLAAMQADAVVAAWRRRPKLDSKRLTMSRRAIRNLLAFMDRAEPWPDLRDPDACRWITAIEARKMVADSPGFRDITTGAPLDEIARPRYATGARGATARDRYYMRKHVLVRGGEPILDEHGVPLAEPPPAPLISNPVVRKAIHEVRRHLVEYMTRFGRKPDQISIELSREARMGAKQADALLFRNRLRSRIRSDIIEAFDLDALSPSQQRAAVVRVILATQQRGVCPLCGNAAVESMLTPRIGAAGSNCEVAHIIPRACGGHNGLGNTVLAHTKCNRNMARRTPRDFWNAEVSGGYDAGINWVEHIYGGIDRPSAAGNTKVSGDALWQSYFTRRDDESKLEQFKKAITDIQEMTNRQDAATKYATRQVMAYLADAVYGGGGLPERGGQRRIFATDGIWTSRLRREWGLFFDPHDAKLKDVDAIELTARREKNRGDHRHHAVDAIIIGCCTAAVQQQWDRRERQAEHEVPNSADEAAMEAYRRLHPLPAPTPFRTVVSFREAVRHAVFGTDAWHRPICHRPVKRKLIGALHEETLFGPVLDLTGGLSGYYARRKQILEIEPNHLRLPCVETERAAIARLAARRAREKSCSENDARRWARGVVRSGFFKPRLVDPSPGKTGLVRDLGLRRTIRRCLAAAGFDPDNFTKQEMKQLTDAGGVRHTSGVPIRAAVLLQAMKNAVIIDRRRQEYATGRSVRDPNPASKRAYVGGNNHHIEIREGNDGKLMGVIVSAFEAAQRKLAKLNAFKSAGIPKPADVRSLPYAARRKLRPIISQIECDHPIVDRRVDESKGGRFVMSLAEGEMLFVCGKGHAGEIGNAAYYVVAKLEKPNRVVLVPHWDARAAMGRKDSSGGRVPRSQREHLSIVPSDLLTLAPEGEQLAFKVRVSALGEVSRLLTD
jgi:CRISPR-associated endonuclease Csn1